MVKNLNHLSGKQRILSFILVLTFVVGIIQIIPFVTTSSMQQYGGNIAEVDAETYDDVSIIEDLEIQEPVSTYQTALDPPVYDYVDSHYYDGYGSTTNFVYMQSSSTSYATLTEAPTFTTNVDFENYWYPWMSEDYSSTEWCEVEVDGQKDFHLEENGGQGSSTSNYAAVIGNLVGNDGGILSPSYDLSSAEYFVFSVYIYDYGLANDDELEVYFRDSGGNYDRKFDWDDCGTPVNGWRYKSLTISDSQYLYNGFRVRYESIGINWLQGTGVDDHRVVAYGSNQLEQRFSFTNVNYKEYRYEFLEIEFDIAVTEPLIIECWSGTAWVQIGQKSSSGMSEMYVHNYLTSSTFLVRLRDYDTTYDTVANTWRIEELRLKMYDHIPENYANPKCDSFYDTDNIYAMKTPRSGSSYAYITTYHSDADGYGDINYCGVAGYSGATRLWEVTYSNSGDSYSAYTGSSYISIEPGTETKSGDTIVIVWHIRFLWTHPDLLNMDIRCRTQDTASNMNTNFILGWDVETRLQSVLEINDNGDDTRGEVGGLLYAGGAVVYYGSGTFQYPPDNAVDIYIISPEVSASPWLALYDNDVGGAQYWTWVSADDQIGLDYYNSKVVEAGAGSGGTDLLVTDDSVAFISDRIRVVGYSVSDARVNVNSDVLIDVTLEYEYDNTAVITGNVQINGQNATHMADGVWRLTKSQSIVTAETFDNVSVTLDTYGISIENQNSQEISVIWDGLIITMLDPTDSRINIGETATGISGTAIYSYDGTPYDGTLVLNSSTFIYGSVGSRGYTIASASGDTYGISVIILNDITSCIWDGLVISMIGPDDSRINIDETATGISGTAVYSYDGAPYDGTLVLNSSTFMYGSVGMRGYTVTSSSGDTFGITTILSNDVTSCIWDALLITITDPTDSRINVGDIATGIVASATYSYDGTVYDGTLTLNSTTFSYGTVGKRGYSVDSASGDSYGITTIFSNDATSCIWDAVNVVTIGSSVLNEVDEVFQVWCTLELSFDNHLLGANDTVVIADQVAVWNGTHFIVEVSYPTPGDRLLFVNSTSEDTYNITVLDVTESCLVHITESPPTTTSETTSTSTTSAGSTTTGTNTTSPGFDGILTIVIVAVFGGVVVTVIIIIILKKR